MCWGSDINWAGFENLYHALEERRKRPESNSSTLSDLSWYPGWAGRAIDLEPASPVLAPDDANISSNSLRRETRAREFADTKFD